MINDDGNADDVQQSAAADGGTTSDNITDNDATNHPPSAAVDKKVPLDGKDLPASPDNPSEQPAGGLRGGGESGKVSESSISPSSTVTCQKLFHSRHASASPSQLGWQFLFAALSHAVPCQEIALACVGDDD
jgi:hypothetical protein